MIMENTLFNNFCKERNLSPGSVKVYLHALNKYTEFNGMTLDELIDEADFEEDHAIRWKRRKLKTRLIDFRNYLIDYGYAKETISTMMKRVTTFYRHYEIEIHHIPKANIKNVVEIKIPTKEDLQKAIELSDPLMESLILFLSSTGLSKIDALKLNIDSFIEATKLYHNETDIYKVLQILKNRDDVIPTFSLIRTKTKKFHHTFCSPEATTALVNYLLTRSEKLTPESKLFKISYHWLTVKFEDLNQQLNLGVTSGNEYAVLRCHTLRKYHGTTLRNDGLSIDIINSLEGRAKNKVEAAYFVDTPEELRKMYIEHVDCLAINADVKRIDLKSEEYLKLENENKKYKKLVDSIDERIERKIREAMISTEEPLSDDEFDDLFS